MNQQNNNDRVVLEPDVLAECIDIIKAKLMEICDEDLQRLTDTTKIRDHVLSDVFFTQIAWYAEQEKSSTVLLFPHTTIYSRVTGNN